MASSLLLRERYKPKNDGGAAGYRFVRRLMAIAYADVVGYSRLMSEDEDRTVARWLAIQHDIIEPKSQAYRGRLVNVIGDTVLLEFASVLDAVAWSRDVQAAIHASNAAANAGPHVELRIAIHLCEVIDEDSSIYGDGINIAARLQAYASPGGIILSETAYEVARVSINLKANSLGSLMLRNIAAPICAYRIDSDSGEAARAQDLGETGLPSIAVLPLQDLSAEPGNSYFGDGIVEDIVVSLSGLREVLVISRDTTLRYSARLSDARYVGRALGVRYVLMGTVRQARNAIKVSVQLFDGQASALIWADSYKKVPLSDLFEVQDEIVERIVAGIAPNVRAAELQRAMRKKPENFSAYDHTLRALEYIHSLDRETFIRARDFLEQAMALDPKFAMPVAWMAKWYSMSIRHGWRPVEDADEGVRYAMRALELDRQNALALATLGHMKSYLFHDYDCARLYLEQARAACPNSALAWIFSSATASYIGCCQEAIRYAERGLRLSPYDRSLYCSYFFLALAYYGAGDYDQAIKWCRMSRSENPYCTTNLRILAAALAAKQDFDQCQEVVQSLLYLEPDFSMGRYANTRQPFCDGDIKKRYLSHLQSAGVPL
jgi:adenylate cyclase